MTGRGSRASALSHFWGSYGHLHRHSDTGGRVDHLQRLIVAFVLLLAPLGAVAAGTVPGQTTQGLPRYSVTELGVGGAKLTTQAAGDFWFEWWVSQAPGSRTSIACTPTVTVPIEQHVNGTYVDARYTCPGQQLVAITYRTIVLWDYLGTTTSCPSNSTASGTPNVCTCNATYNPDANGTACVMLPAPICKVASLGSVNFEFPVTAGGSVSGQLPASMTACTPVAATSTTAAGGCTHKYDLLLASRASDGATTAIGNYAERTDGTNCTPGPSPNPVPESGPAPTNPTAPGTGTADDPKPTPNPSTICALGAGSVAMCPTLINGMLACVVCGQMATAGNGQTGGAGTAPAGPASAPGSTGSGGTGQSINTGNGTVGIPTGGSALQGTECTGAVCTTKTFVKDSSGNIVGSYTSSTPATVFCASNPGDPICIAKNTGTSGVPGTGGGSSGSGNGTGTGGAASAPAGSFGGSCGSGFTCSGDAVQCAFAKEQSVNNCRWLDSHTPESQAGLDAIAADQSRHTAGTNARGADTEVNIAVKATASAVNPYAASCPADQTINVAGANIVIPMSSACTFLQALGLIAVSITVLTCAGWLVTKGV